MKNEFIPYEQALELKELGFDSNLIGGYKQDAVFYYEKGELYYDYRPMYSSTSHEGQILAPLYQQAFRWFREKHKSTIHIYQYQDTQRWDFDIYDNVQEEYDFGNPSYGTYEEAELACLKKLIEIVKGKEVAINCHTYS
jgi:hypothetical protein